MLQNLVQELPLTSVKGDPMRCQDAHYFVVPKLSMDTGGAGNPSEDPLSCRALLDLVPLRPMIHEGNDRGTDVFCEGPGSLVSYGLNVFRRRMHSSEKSSCPLPSLQVGFYAA